LTKPFDRRELMGASGDRPSLKDPQIRHQDRSTDRNLDPDGRRGWRAPSPDRQEYGILELLSLRKGPRCQGVPNHLYGGMDEPELKIIDVFVCKLRKKLSQATSGENYIETVWGRGYVLRDPETERTPVRKAAQAAKA
jgi:two-component system cell cycle response regulator CtrA